MSLFERVLTARRIVGQGRETFLHPKYENGHDPFLLPDMQKAVDRLVVARERQERITIYGDYDIDGLTATAVLVDALESFGFRFVETYIPNRFVEGYGLTVEAVEKIANTGTDIIITVDCGSLSEREIVRANELGVDVIVTDHHNVADVQPPAVAVINPKRLLKDNPSLYEDYLLKSQYKTHRVYPFLDLPGVGVAFKLVQAMQSRLDGLDVGQEKWLLDLVALGTVCDVVNLIDENRTHVYWGLKVLAKTRRPGLRALMAVAHIESNKLDARSLGFGLGPRMNATGRLDTAQYSLDMLLAQDTPRALSLATQLDVMNSERRALQDQITKEADMLARKFHDDKVLVVSAPGWSHGIIGIVAAKLLERYKKPTFVLEEMGDEAKGSARSYGDFSVADAIRASDDVITKGGGHKLAAGVTLPVANVDAFRQRVNDFYHSLNLRPQAPLLKPEEDVVLESLSDITIGAIEELQLMEPFGAGNPEPVLRMDGLRVIAMRTMGADAQHLKLEVRDVAGAAISCIAFNADKEWFVGVGDVVNLWMQPIKNEWNGRVAAEARIVGLER